MSTVSSTSTPVSIASTSSSATSAAAGGSVIDVSSLVSQLVAATRAPKDSVIATQTSQVTTKISALGTLKGALSTFQTSLAAIDTPDSFNALAANSSDSTVFTATVDSGAVAGAYSVAVTQLATAQQIVSTGVLGGSSAALGTGTLQISLGGTSFSISADSTNDTLSGIASAINTASGNPGVTATVISGTDGAHLVLSSTQTGAANTIQVTETDGGSALSALTYGTGNKTHYTQNSAAQDAQFSISGIPHTSTTNTVTDALGGVTLTLLGTTAGATGGTSTSTAASATLSISNDSKTIEDNVSTFVDAYNTLVAAITPLSSYDQTTGTAGPMLGDALLSGIQNEIRSTLHGVVDTGSSTYNSLASVGITTNADGTLNLNQSKFATALTTTPGAVSALFSSTGGIATNLNSHITNDLAASGSIVSRSKTLVSQENGLTQQTDDLNTSMQALTASLTQQYASLNTLLSTLQSTSAYLSQQFAALPTVQQKG
jgi:flagellar hook-associated protein 2